MRRDIITRNETQHHHDFQKIEMFPEVERLERTQDIQKTQVTAYTKMFGGKAYNGKAYNGKAYKSIIPFVLRDEMAAIDDARQESEAYCMESEWEDEDMPYDLLRSQTMGFEELYLNWQEKHLHEERADVDAKLAELYAVV